MTPTEEAIAAYFERLKDTEMDQDTFDEILNRIKALRVLTQDGKK